MGVQIRPEVCRIMNAIFSVVMSEAAMMRSPSFSREGESSTTMNSPLRKAVIASGIVEKPGEVEVGGGMAGVVLGLCTLLVMRE